MVWDPPPDDDAEALLAAVAARLRASGARSWQIELTAGVIAASLQTAAVTTPTSAELAEGSPGASGRRSAGG